MCTSSYHFDGRHSGRQDVSSSVPEQGGGGLIPEGQGKPGAMHLRNRLELMGHLGLFTDWKPPKYHCR